MVPMKVWINLIVVLVLHFHNRNFPRLFLSTSQFSEIKLLQLLRKGSFKIRLLITVHNLRQTDQGNKNDSVYLVKTHVALVYFKYVRTYFKQVLQIGRNDIEPTTSFRGKSQELHYFSFPR